MPSWRSTACQTPETQARVLMTYLIERWRSSVDTISMRMPPPTVADIFAGMKIIEEWQNVRDESEHGEENYAGRFGGGNRVAEEGGQQQQQHLARQATKNKAMAATICYVCGRQGHYATKCSIRTTAFCTYCKITGHLLAACKRRQSGAGAGGGGAGGSGGAEGSGGGAAPVQPRPKLLPHGKKAQARGGAVAFVCKEVLDASEGNRVAEVVEWLGDTYYGVKGSSDVA